MPRIERPSVRWMIRRDMPSVLEIEHATNDHPRSEEAFLAVLRKRNCIGMVAEVGEGAEARVFGFMVYTLHKEYLELMTLASATWHPRHQIVDDALVAKLKSKLSYHRRTWISYAVRESCLGEQVTLRDRHGFRAVEVIRGFYDDTRESAYLFEHRLGAGEFVATADEGRGELWEC